MNTIASGKPRPAPAATTTIIRDATDVDLPAIIDIYNAAIATRMSTAQLEPVTVEGRRDWLREHSPDRNPFWVAEIDGCVAGWLSFKTFLPRCAYRGTIELSVYVDEKFRRRGIAKKLLEEANARASSLGITALVGLIFAHNESSLRLFERLGFQRWGLLPGIARLDEIERDLIVMGRHCPARFSHGPLGRPVPAIDAPQARGYSDALNLMHTLIQYRQEPIHWQLVKIRNKYSMLHLDVLLLIYHFAKTCGGQIVELGAFVGGATIAAAWGVRDSGNPKALIVVEPGGSVKHERLGTKNIFRDLERNLAKQRVANMVTLVKGRSSETATISAVHHKLGADQIGLLILDADGAVQRDIDSYRDKLAEGCWMIIDDYSAPATNIKVTRTRSDVDTLVATGHLEPLGFYGWGTWVGRWRRNGYASSRPTTR